MTPSVTNSSNAQLPDPVATTGAQLKQAAVIGGTAVAATGGLVALARSSRNRDRMLDRVAGHGTPDDAMRASAALHRIRTRRGLTPAIAADGERALRSYGSTVSRLRHPIAKVELNAAARNLGQPAELSTKQALEYGAHLRYHDVVGGVVEDTLRNRSMRYIAPASIAMGLGMGALTTAMAVSVEGGMGDGAKRSIGNVIGGTIGGIAGAALGARLGVRSPVLGTAMGGLTGGLLGTYAGRIGLGAVTEQA